MSSAKQDDFADEVLHALSQPLTTLECGLELALRQDRTAADFRRRIATLQEIASTLHRRLVEIRGQQESMVRETRCKEDDHGPARSVQSPKLIS